MAIDKNDNEMATHLMNHSAINLNVCNVRVGELLTCNCLWYTELVVASTS